MSEPFNPETLPTPEPVEVTCTLTPATGLSAVVLDEAFSSGSSKGVRGMLQKMVDDAKKKTK